MLRCRTVLAGRAVAGLTKLHGVPTKYSRLSWTNRFDSVGACRRFSALSTEPASEVGGLLRLLTEEESALLEEQRALTARARDLASNIEQVQVRNYTQNFLSDILPETEDYSTFSIVVAGEFNAGKSTVINALLGQKLLETGALPTTDSITIISHCSSDETHHNVGGHGGVVLHHVSRVPLLQDLTLVDTPGTNAVILDHTARTLKLLPEADLILFVTSADRPFPESERKLLQSIQAYRKNIVVVINKMDVLESSGGNFGDEEKHRVVEFVTENASELLGARPIVIPISARDAMSAKVTYIDRTDRSGLWQRSNFKSLETFLKDTLTTEAKIKSKLLNPIGVSEGMMAECSSVLAEQRQELETDISTLNLLKSQFGGWVREVDNEITDLRNDAARVFLQEEEKGEAFVNRLDFIEQHVASLEAGQLESKWHQLGSGSSDALQDLESTLLCIVRETADTIAIRARAQGQAVIEYLGKRPSMKSQSLVGSVTAASRFEDIRTNLEDNMSKAVRRALNDQDVAQAAEKLLVSIRQTSYVSGVMQLTALGTAAATALQAVDVVPGLVGSSAFAAASGLVLSQGNQHSIKAYRAAWELQWTKLDEDLETVCSRELQKVHKRILDGVAPYSRYVETEQERIHALSDECETVLASAQALRNRINKKLHH